VIDPGAVIRHWGYPAIFGFVLAGTAGLPVPEESVLVAGGYLAWRGVLRLPLVITVGIVSAAAGDNLGYWLGRRYGRRAIERYGRHVLITAERLDRAQRFVARHGPPAVFVARFLPGLRAWVGPIAGMAGTRYLPFCVANTLGAACFAPLAVLAGYAVGYGLGDRLERLRGALGGLEHWLLAIGLIGAGAVLLWRLTRTRRTR
jgi:membrane protein DedA with SNARE-associated domain